jgi:sugar lactone lactonase YvrE
MSSQAPLTANLVCVDPDGLASQAADDLNFPNGSVILSDGVTLVVGETYGARYTAWTIQPGGTLANRRVWAELGTPIDVDATGKIIAFPTVAPDGCAVDGHDRIWMADPAGGRVALVAEGGDILDEIRTTHGLRPYACSLGGATGTTLLICAAPDYFAQRRAAMTEAVLYTVEIDGN